MITLSSKNQVTDNSVYSHKKMSLAIQIETMTCQMYIFFPFKIFAEKEAVANTVQNAMAASCLFLHIRGRASLAT